MTHPEWARCVGAVVCDDQHRVYVQLRALGRPVLPGIWDIIGDYLKHGEDDEAAVRRSLREQVGWRLRRMEAAIGDWDWTHDGATRHETDYLVEVDGDLSAPCLNPRKHSQFAWVGPKEIRLLEQGWLNYDSRLRDVVAKAMRIRITSRLRLEPIGPEHASDLWRINRGVEISSRRGGEWTLSMASNYTSRYHRQWEDCGAGMWMAYERASGNALGYGGLRISHAGCVELTECVMRNDITEFGYVDEITEAAMAFSSEMKSG